MIHYTLKYMRCTYFCALLCSFAKVSRSGTRQSQAWRSRSSSSCLTPRIRSTRHAPYMRGGLDEDQCFYVDDEWTISIIERSARMGLIVCSVAAMISISCASRASTSKAPRKSRSWLCRRRSCQSSTASTT